MFAAIELEKAKLIVNYMFWNKYCRPICRTVSDAVQVLEVIAGYDARDSATVEAVKYIPKGGYKQFLKIDGLKGKRLGILKDYFDYSLGSVEAKAFEKHFQTMR